MSPRRDAQEARNAVVIASATSVIMPGLREPISENAPVRKGRPPQAYMTVPSTGATQPSQAASRNG